MRLIHRYRQHRRSTARLLLGWLLLSGSLFCPAYASMLPDNAGGQHQAESAMPCHGEVEHSSTDASCCENAASLCCGDAKQSAAGIADIDVSATPVAALAGGSTAGLWQNAAPPLWTEDIFLRRSDPPIHLLNCTFLD